MLLNLVLLAVGFVFLILGANWLVGGATALARKFGISDLAIGLTVVAFGTSAPELVVNIIAASEGRDALVFGNVIGSNNFNLFMILGIAGLIAPLTVHSNTVTREIPLSLLAGILVFLLTTAWFGASNMILTRIDGSLLLLFFAGFIFYVYKQLKEEPVTEQKVSATSQGGLKTALLIVVGLAGLIGGGRLVVIHAVEMAVQLGLSEKVIGLTIVAAGTSLPELATSVVAVLRKNNDIAIGNVIGSNIFNIFLILGVSAWIRPITYTAAFNVDLILLCLGTVALLLMMFTGKRHALDRWQAGILLLVYGVYTTYLIQSA
jgi:cation:H+ antiporter